MFRGKSTFLQTLTAETWRELRYGIALNHNPNAIKSFFESRNDLFQFMFGYFLQAVPVKQFGTENSARKIYCTASRLLVSTSKISTFGR